jgi:sensor histidine kinase YesM
MIAGVSFEGEYKIGDGEWLPIIKGEHIPADKGDVTLRGIFIALNPETGNPLSPLSSGATVSLYFNHIGGTAILPNGGKIIFDAENERIGEDVCAIMWGSVPATGDSPITIILHNPHKFGNPNAIDDFFQNMSIAPGTYLESIMLEKGSTERSIGTMIFIISIFILGISAFSTFIHTKYSMEMWLIGLMSFFAGGYFIFDAFAVSFWNEPNIFNTRALGLCMMFYILFSTILIVTQLEGKIKKAGSIAASVSALSILYCIAASFSSNIKFFDTWFSWAIVETAVALTLIICQIISFRKTTNSKKFLYLVGISTLFTFILDFVATGIGWWEGGYVSKLVFLAVFIIALIVALRIIPSHINAAMKARELEAEKQALKLELQESRISIMLSQMRPHFIFNTLNTIYHLCEINPETARSTIDSFSKYLRNNIDNLDRSEMIHFEKEMSFVKAYLDIEKVRFDDELQIIFDIAVTNFKLPVLTMQPIVENAVKHGTSKKEGVSTLRISTRETNDCYEIEICDTGVGFDIDHLPNDEHKHIGIINVRQRLKHLCDGTLSIESTVGKGTTAIIKIPKKEDSNT